MFTAPRAHSACMHVASLVSQAKTTKDIHTGQESTKQPPPPPQEGTPVAVMSFKLFFSLAVTSHQTRQTERWHCWQQTINPSNQRLR